MPRQARATLNSNLLKITQASETTLFRNDADRDFFLERLAQLQRRYAFKVLAFCCGESHGFQLVLDTQGANIAKIMQSLTISYALHRKSAEKLFVQRYKSQALHSDAEVKAEISAILNNPRYSGCCFKAEQGTRFDWVSVKPKTLYHQNLKRSALDQTQATAALARWMDEFNCDRERLKHDKTLRNQCLMQLRTHHDVSLKTLADLFALSESAVSKILKQPELGT